MKPDTAESRNRRMPDTDQQVVISDLRAGEEGVFALLNLQWIETYFRVEAADHAVFADPWKAVIDPGGSILFARLGDRIVGTCALVRHDAARWELAKMAVTDDVRGRGIGELLGRAVVERTRSNGGKELFLETNDRLIPALRLYRKLGFRDAERPGGPSSYQRANVYMVLHL